MLKIRGGTASLLFLAQGRSRSLLHYKSFRDRVTAIRAKGMVNRPKMGETSRLPDIQDRGHVSIATSLDT